MPGPSAKAFEAFFNHEIRLRWDTLLSATYVEGGGTHPYAGAISANRGRGWKSGMAMRTRFLVCDPPRQASAYTYAIELRPTWLEASFGWAGNTVYAWEMRRRFRAMAAFLRTRN